MMEIATPVDWVFLIAIALYLLSLVRWGDGALAKVPWIVLGHVGVAFGLFLAL